MAASPFDLDTWAQFLVNIGSHWSTAIHAPKTLLRFSPSDKELVDGVAFYLEMLGISMVLSAPLILQHKAEFSDKVRMAATTAFSMVSRWWPPWLPIWLFGFLAALAPSPAASWPWRMGLVLMGRS